MSMLKGENRVSTEAADKFAKLVFKTMEADAVITYDLFEKETGLHRKHPSWHGFLKKFRRELRTARGWCLEPVTGVGYRIMTYEATVTRQMSRRAKKQMSQARMAQQEAGAVPDDQLDTKHRELKYRAMECHRESGSKAMFTRRLIAAVGGETD